MRSGRKYEFMNDVKHFLCGLPFLEDRFRDLLFALPLVRDKFCPLPFAFCLLPFAPHPLLFSNKLYPFRTTGWRYLVHHHAGCRNGY